MQIDITLFTYFIILGTGPRLSFVSPQVAAVAMVVVLVVVLTLVAGNIAATVVAIAAMTALLVVWRTCRWVGCSGSLFTKS